MSNLITAIERLIKDVHFGPMTAMGIEQRLRTILAIANEYEATHPCDPDSDHDHDPITFMSSEHAQARIAQVNERIAKLKASRGDQADHG